MVSESQEPSPFTSGDRVIDAFGKKYTVKLCQLRTDWSKVRWCVETTCGRNLYAADLKHEYEAGAQPEVVQAAPVDKPSMGSMFIARSHWGEQGMESAPNGAFVAYVDHCNYLDKVVAKDEKFSHAAMSKLLTDNLQLKNRIAEMEQRFLRMKTSNAELQDQVRRAEAEVVKVKAKDPCVPLTRIADALDRVVQIRHVSGGK